MPVFIKLKYGSEVFRWRLFYVPALPDVKRCLYEKWPQLRAEVVNIYYVDDDGDKCHLTEGSFFDAWEIAKHRVEGTDRTPTLKFSVELQTAVEAPLVLPSEPQQAAVPCLLVPLSLLKELKIDAFRDGWMCSDQGGDHAMGASVESEGSLNDNESVSSGWQEVSRQNEAAQ
ncbi:hypothetical protein Pmar_PMAR025054 [Perkinsus marinus ATCC 50983]|uniref:PB1 domain-containing protein n=1 Tax=Perkinsus marinus (strain ATCC 50983 / TXsc) TaxID=423536 RepID=C5KLQ7_PERM5|nr:hypothetical protein Pmar_PMAR025054 [Perkinsus marinus ATCC 50983]EER14590.1 hypothetical protein Pmar_PMAR025054 [Perkinsus marinus ATCC 50983]|eukprot:XP_002782795.1 hypothetical protein Pmar_PMAR025054 [Perkinsus marinus ATCC 50983]